MNEIRWPQGVTSTHYYKWNTRYYFNKNDKFIFDLNDISNQSDKVHIFLGVVHYHRYDISNGYNPKHGYIYDVLLTDENDEPIAICQIHPLEGNEVICTKDEKIFDILVMTFKSAHREALNKEENKKY